MAAACSNNHNNTGGPSPSAGGSSPSESAATSAPAELTVELDWVPNPDHVGLYYAQDKGYFTDANLTVDFHSPSNAADPIKLVGLDKVDLAISYEPEMFYGQQNELPVVAVATVVPVPLNSMIVSPDATVTQLSDLSGKSVGVTGIPSDDAFYQTMLKTAGLTEGDVTKVNVGFNLVPSVLSNKVDGIIGGYRNVEAIQVEQETGTKPTVFPADELGVPTYAELVVVANSDRLASDAGLRRRRQAVRGHAGEGDRRGDRRPDRRDGRDEDRHAVRPEVPRRERPVHADPADAGRRDEDRMHRRGRVAELRRLDEDQRPDHVDAGRGGDRHRPVHAVQLLLIDTPERRPGPRPSPRVIAHPD